MALEPNQIMRLMLRQRVRWVAYLATIVHDRHFAEDLFQDLIMQAMEKADTIQDEDHLRGWLLTAARYLAFNHIRKQNARPVCFSSEVLDRLDQFWDGPTGDDDSSDMVESLQECLKVLSPNAREMVEMRYRNGLNGKQIAKTMERKPSAIYTAMSRIHTALARCIKERKAGVGALP